ncbi:MAG TPA: phage portal protein, partial [Nitrospira sp.]|nr:phage portal protein [Nitrospira sp.]
MYTRLRVRGPIIGKQEAYYAGEQRLTFATDEWLRANGSRYASFSDNWCASVANAETERVRVTGIKLRGDRDSAVKRASKLWDQWSLNELEAQSSQGFLTSFVAKRSYVLVWGDGENAQVTWEHPANVEIEYDWMNPRQRKAAMKTWVDESAEYLTLYTADAVYKWQRPRGMVQTDGRPQSEQMEVTPYSAVGQWTPRQPVGDDSWPLPNPLGAVPIVEIPNRPLLRGEPLSEIDPVIPKQDAINLLWAYLMFAADYASMPARVLLGATPPMRKILDDQGNVVGQEPLTMRELNETRFAVFSGENAKIDQWDPAKLDVFTETIDVLVGHIASQTRT